MPLCQNQTLAETRQQGLLHQFGNSAKWSRSSGPGVNSQSHGAMFVAVHHQELACKETDSALNSGLQSKRTNAISLTEQETRKDTDERQGGGERKKKIEGESAKAIESAHGNECTWKEGQSRERESVCRSKRETGSWSQSQNYAIRRAENKA